MKASFCVVHCCALSSAWHLLDAPYMLTRRVHMHEHALFNCVIGGASFVGKNLLPFDRHMCEWCGGISMHQVEGHSGDTAPGSQCWWRRVRRAAS